MNRHRKSVVDMDEHYFRMVIRDENANSWKEQKKELANTYMSKGECLTVHQGGGDHRPKNGDKKEPTVDPLKMAKVKFWMKLTGLVSVLVILIGTITTILTVSYLS